MRSYSEVDEVLEEEKIDDELEEYVIQERLAREKKWSNPFKWKKSEKEDAWELF